ncbi:hypothetical protein [Sporosarcina jiandibaonis]|uniref:hypothetical protein n=1 Tax=Sporosarcina jiandibaonis TaxID=2715535 RepID=UPI001551A761|nr:hypothetical protein [Sporosarcina jiandibaonis]
MEKVKKPFYKKWWVWLIAVIFVVAVASSGDDSEVVKEDGQSKAEASAPVTDKEKDDTKVDEAKENETDANDGVEEEEVATTSAIKAGTYKVGADLPAGEYLVFSNGHTYIESAKDSSGNLDSIIFNDNLMNNAHAYVTLNEGEYFKMTGGEMYPVEDAKSVIPEDGLYQDGMYKVGKDISAGEYKVILTSDLGMGYLEVSADSSHQLGSIITNDNVQADTYITVKENQYLKLQGLEIQK